MVCDWVGIAIGVGSGVLAVSIACVLLAGVKTSKDGVYCSFAEL